MCLATGHVVPMTAEEGRLLPANEESPTNKWTSRRLISIALLFIALPYLCFYIAQQWSVLLDAITRLRFPTLVGATALLVIMLVMKSAYHVLAIRRLGNENNPSTSRIVAAYAASQVIRYLPGKVLGVVYEAARLADAVPAYRIVAANIVQGLHTMALTLGVLAAAGVWIYSDHTALALGVLAMAFAALWATHRLHFIERCVTWAARRIPKLRDIPPLARPAKRGALPASLILLAEWIPYYAFWCLLLPSGEASLQQAVLLGSCYAAAALFANFAVVMPSGLIVREALFLWAGTQLSLDAPSLIVFGMISRLLFTLADATFAPLSWAYDRLLSREHG